MGTVRLLCIFCVTTATVFGDQSSSCVKTEDGKCWSYDSRYLAADINEAIASFRDLTMLDPPDPVDNDSPDYCVTEECKVCQRAIKQRLCQLGIAQFNATDMPLVKDNVTCTRYNLKHSGDKDFCDGVTEGSSPSRSEEVEKDGIPYSQETMRSMASGSTEPILGKRNTVNCILKGEEPDGEGYISLCTACWTWRKLPPGFYPEYLNELICSDSDKNCLGGYGHCRNGFRKMHVLRKINGVYQPVTLDAATFCECRSTEYSAIYNFITMNRSGPLPPSSPPILDKSEVSFGSTVIGDGIETVEV